MTGGRCVVRGAGGSFEDLFLPRGRFNFWEWFIL